MMSIFSKFAAFIGASKPIDELVKAYPASSFHPDQSLLAYPRKDFLGHRAVHAYRTEFLIALDDVIRVLDVLHAEFNLPSDEKFQEGSAQNGAFTVHYSLRPEFRGAVVTIITNCSALLRQLDALDLSPPPPWDVFPDADPSTLGSLQGDIGYWWNWFFMPFWSAAKPIERSRYLDTHRASAAWREFIEMHAS